MKFSDPGISKPVVLFFARGYQADFFPHLISDKYEAIFVTLTIQEKKSIAKMRGRIVGCFEEDYNDISAVTIHENYLITSFMSDRFLGRFSYNKRLEILGKEISFWSSIFEKYKPRAVVNELVAIEISEVLLIESKKRNILYLAGMNCPADDYFYWLNNPLSLSGRYLHNVVPGKFSLEIAKKYIEEVLAKDYKPFYVKNLKGRLNLFTLLVSFAKLFIWNLKKYKSLFSGGFRYELYIDEYSKKVAVYFKSIYTSYDKIDNLPAGKEVVFFPLHQEPEATLNYMSEFYANQVATIENILKCLSNNQVLAVKEHPVDKGSLLRKKFLNLKKQYSALYYFPAEIHGRQIMKVANRIITLTSTVGWEAIVTGKTVYVLGEIFYDNLDGIPKINDFNDLKRELRNAPANDRVSIEYLTTFIAIMTEQCYAGNPFPHEQLYSDTNKERIIDAIVDAINKRDQNKSAQINAEIFTT